MIEKIIILQLRLITTKHKKCTIINRQVLNQQRQNKKKKTMTNLQTFQNPGTQTENKIFLSFVAQKLTGPTSDELPFFTLTIKTKLRQKWLLILLRQKKTERQTKKSQQKKKKTFINRFGFSFLKSEKMREGKRTEKKSGEPATDGWKMYLIVGKMKHLF